ncbi:MAG: hypothetical protein PHI59_00940 [Candidatus Omnitrophica bacterium]|nr:hypothetical protein [Candidatus Omnitrophota bacterium]MDD5679795.1 hypothetical protein [Candidatus Omnitrophota bacterium]
MAIYAVHKFHIIPAASKHSGTISSKTAAFEEFDLSEYSEGGACKKLTIQGKKLGVVAKKLGIFRLAPLKVTEIRDASITFYEKGAVVSRITAKKAFLNASFGDDNSIASIVKEMDLSGTVDVVTGDRRTLVCSSLKWDNSRNRIFASGNCVLRFDNNVVRADQIDSDLKLTDFNSKNDRLKRLRTLSRAVI